MREGETGRGKRSIIEMSCILIFIRISSFERAGGERNEGTENEYIIYTYMYIYSYIWKNDVKLPKSIQNQGENRLKGKCNFFVDVEIIL